MTSLSISSFIQPSGAGTGIRVRSCFLHCIIPHIFLLLTIPGDSTLVPLLSLMLPSTYIFVPVMLNNFKQLKTFTCRCYAQLKSIGFEQRMELLIFQLRVSDRTRSCNHILHLSRISLTVLKRLLGEMGFTRKSRPSSRIPFL